MESPFEDRRCLHEERDRIEIAVVNEILSKKSNHREKLDSEHRQKMLLDRYRRCSKKLLSIYEKDYNDHQSNTEDPYEEFYSKLKAIKEFYSKNSNEQVVTLANEFEEIEAARQIAMGVDTKITSTNKPDDEDTNKTDSDEFQNDKLDPSGEILRLTQGLPTTDLVEVIEPTDDKAVSSAKIEKQIEFTDEEGYGRYLDLTKCHEALLQVLKKEEKKPNYLTFLDTFDRFETIKREQKLNSTYKNYVESLIEYLRDYCRRAKPLFDYENMEKNVLGEFSNSWDRKVVRGWFNESDRVGEELNPMIDVDSFKSCKELEGMGLDCLKKELQARGLKCGGTLEERAKRLWSVRGKLPAEIDPALRAGPIIRKKKKAPVEPYYIASLEALISMHAEHLSEIRQATIENVQRKQARTAEERNESDEDLSEIDDDANDADDFVYNPKNLPLGWDGKPIPYWLYKLHGLNLTFTCEICGNATYKGPKTFQRHFSEWRHANGMRCLGIPNTAHFANITRIQDAISLWDKIKNEKKQNEFQPSVEEEFEDSQGNVVTKKTYEDLKRQGLL